MGTGALEAPLRRAWDVLKTTHTSASNRWKRTRGPMGVVINYLYELGWDPYQMDEWHGPEDDNGARVRWRFAEDGNMRDFFDAVRASLLPKIWAMASDHWAGARAEKGLDFTVGRVLKQLDSAHNEDQLHARERVEEAQVRLAYSREGGPRERREPLRMRAVAERRCSTWTEAQG